MNTTHPHRRYKDKEKRRKYKREYMREYMKRRRRLKYQADWERNYLRRLREKALEVLGGAVCRGCGCDVLAILEINHKSGGGGRERAGMAQAQFYRALINGKIDRKKYDVLCRICNALHYVRDILKIKGHKVIWG